MRDGECIAERALAVRPHVVQKERGWMGRLLDGVAQWTRRPVVVPLKGGSVVDVSWNAHTSLLAAATRNDCIYLYDANTQQWIDSAVLQHAKQMDIASIAWRPAGHDLAVACRGGICVWTLRPGGASALSHFVDVSVRELPGDDCVALAWSPCANYLLWSGRRGIGVWDVNARQHRYLAWLAGASCVHWSPSGQGLVYAGAQDHSFWFFSSLDAVPQRWRCSSRAVKFLLWHPSNSWLVVFCEGDRNVHVLQRSLRGPEFSYSTSFALPALPQCVACSPCGRRLALGLEGKPQLAVLDWTSGTRLYPIAFLPAPEGATQAKLVRFKEDARFLLCCAVWSNDVISFSPLHL